MKFLGRQADSTKPVDAIAGYLFLALVFYFLYPYLARFTEFSHNDVMYNYFPFRRWFIESIKNGHVFPLWDPFSGLGRFAGIWTTIPIDLLSPLDYFFHMRFSELFCIQAFLIFFLAWRSFRWLGFSPLLSLLGMTMFLLAPATHYFLYYYIHSWAYLLYAFCFYFQYRYRITRKPRFLLLTMAVVLCFCVGGKVDLVFQALLVLSCSIWAMARTQSAGGAKPRELLFCWISLWAPLLVQAWYFNLVFVSAGASIRSPNLDFSWLAFGSSIAALGEDLQLAVLAAAVLLLVFREPILRMRQGKACFLSMAVLISAAGVYLALPNLLNAGPEFTGARGDVAHVPSYFYLLGYVSAVAASLLLRATKDWSVFAAGLLKTQVIVYYLGRPAPGDVEEVLILHGASIYFKFCIAFLSSLGLLSKPPHRLVQWAFWNMAAVLFLRSAGLVFLNHLFGVLWLPARDNFLMDLPMAVAAVFGARRLVQFMLFGLQNSASKIPAARLRLWRKMAWAAPGALSILIFAADPRTGAFEAFPYTLLSDKLILMAHQWSQSMAVRTNPPTRKIRILSYFHNFGRLNGIADAREYQSLATARYARYSISQRLGIPAGKIGNVGGTTAALSDHYIRLIKKTQTIRDLSASLPAGIDFYYDYLIHAVPPLNCNQMKLLGIRFIEGEDGRYLSAWSNTQSLNHLYSLADPQARTLSPDVARKINACGFEKVKIGDRSFWKVTGYLPEAIFIAGVSEQRLLSASPSDVSVMPGNVLQFKDGARFWWEPVRLSQYEPNAVGMRPVGRRRAWPDGVVMLTDLYDDHWDARVGGPLGRTPSGVFPALSLFRAISVKQGTRYIQYFLPYPRKTPTIVATLLGLALCLYVFLATRSKRPQSDTVRGRAC